MGTLLQDTPPVKVFLVTIYGNPAAVHPCFKPCMEWNPAAVYPYMKIVLFYLRHGNPAAVYPKMKELVVLFTPCMEWNPAAVYPYM